VLSTDSMFLMGKYEGTMLIVIAIVEKENNGSCDWFLRFVRRVVVGPGREIGAL
jgi:hypothetical protein